ncbi:hypothetical protein HDE_04245 [Halotydeus destructor]|nr:hypothetical protein HDE_04245 [Halotydeus destructor]
MVHSLSNVVFTLIDSTSSLTIVEYLDILYHLTLVKTDIFKFLCNHIKQGQLSGSELYALAQQLRSICFFPEQQLETVASNIDRVFTQVTANCGQEASALLFILNDQRPASELFDKLVETFENPHYRDFKYIYFKLKNEHFTELKEDPQLQIKPRRAVVDHPRSVGNEIKDIWKRSHRVQFAFIGNPIRVDTLEDEEKYDILHTCKVISSTLGKELNVPF